MQGFEGFIEEYKNIQCRAGGDGRHFYPTWKLLRLFYACENSCNILSGISKVQYFNISEPENLDPSRDRFVVGGPLAFLALGSNLYLLSRGIPMDTWTALHTEFFRPNHAFPRFAVGKILNVLLLLFLIGQTRDILSVFISVDNPKSGFKTMCTCNPSQPSSN